MQQCRSACGRVSQAVSPEDASFTAHPVDRIQTKPVGKFSITVYNHSMFIEG